MDQRPGPAPLTGEIADDISGAIRYAVAVLGNHRDVASGFHAPVIQAHMNALLAIEAQLQAEQQARAQAEAERDSALQCQHAYEAITRAIADAVGPGNPGGPYWEDGVRWLQEQKAAAERAQEALRVELAEAKAERDRRIEPLEESDDPEEAEAIRMTPTYVLMTRAAADGDTEIRRAQKKRADALAQANATLREYAQHTSDCQWWRTPAPARIVREAWDDVEVGHGVKYGKCPSCGVARVAEWCPPPCNTQSARHARMLRAEDARRCSCGLWAILSPPSSAAATEPARRETP